MYISFEKKHEKFWKLVGKRSRMSHSWAENVFENWKCKEGMMNKPYMNLFNALYEHCTTKN